MNKTWKCSECGHFAAPNWCKVKEIKVDCNFDGPCDHANSLSKKRRIEKNERLPILCGFGCRGGLWLTYIRLKKIFEELEEEKEDWKP